MKESGVNHTKVLNFQKTVLSNEIVCEDLSYPKSPVECLDFSFHVMFLVLEFFNCIWKDHKSLNIYSYNCVRKE